MAEAVTLTEEQIRQIRRLLRAHLMQPRTPHHYRFILGALVALGEGRYGRCYNCDEPISWARLEQSPYTVRCAVCKAEAVRGR